MPEQQSENMVLRTVYLPRELDQQLKTAAFRDARSKNDIIRELIQIGMRSRRAAGDRRFDEQPIEPGQGPAVVQPVERVVVAPANAGRQAGEPEARRGRRA
jgi:hypothetical protein